MTQVLSVVWYKVLPARFGGQKGIAEFNAHLAERLSLTCLCSADNDPEAANHAVLPLLPVGKRQVLDPRNWWKILHELRRLESTHLIIEHCYYAMAGIWARSRLSIPWILHQHNIEYLRFRQLGKWWWPILCWFEGLACRKADLVLFKTDADREHALKVFGMDHKKAMLVPFGLQRDHRPSPEELEAAGVRIRKHHGIPVNTAILLFSGTLDYGPNAKAFESLVTNIIPQLDSILSVPFIVLVCGRLRDPSFDYLRRLQHEKLCFAGEVEDISPYFMAANLFINPVTEGGGIKVKTLEALSYDLTVVSTGHSAIGIDRELTGDKLRVCQDDDWEDFCRLVKIAIPETSTIPDAFFTRYQWRHVTKQVAEAIQQLTI